MTEVDTFGEQRGGRTEHHYEEVCSRCGWRRQGRSRLDPAAWAEQLSRDARLFRFGADKMALGAVFSELRIRAEAPCDWPTLPEVTSSRAVGVLLDHLAFRAVPVCFDTGAGSCELLCRPLDLAHAASTLGQALAQRSFGRALVGGGATALEVEAPPARVARLVEGDVEQWVGPAGVVLEAVAQLWHAYHRELRTKSRGSSAPFEAALHALGAGLPVPASPVEPLGEGLELLERLAPAVHREVVGSLEGMEGRDIWRGVRVDGDLPWPLKMASWIDANRDQEGAYLLRLRPGRVTMLSRTRGRLAVVDDAFSITDLVGVGARLSFAWEHRATFVDGLSLVQGKLDAVAQLRVPAAQPLTLAALRGDHATVVVEPRAAVTVGRASDNDLVLAHRLVSKKQSVLSAQGDGWLISDAGSTSGTYVEHAQIRRETPLCFGDRLDLGGLALVVV